MGDQLELGRSVAVDVIYEDVQLRVIRTGERAVSLSGDVDFSNSGALAEALTLVRGGSGEVVVDVGELRFVDVSGLRVLALPHLDLPERWLWLCNVRPYLQRLMRLLEWDPVSALH